MANDIEVSVGYGDIQTLRRELVGIAKDAKTSASVFEREYNKVERVLNANAKASQTYYASVLKLDQASKSASSSASVFVKALNEEAKAVKELAQVEKELIASRAKLDATAKQEANTLDQLKSKFQAGYGAMKTFKGEVEQLNLALKLGVISQDEYKAKVEQLSVALAKGTGIFGAHANQAKGYMNQLGVITQQAGYQVGDFFVQIQGGTNVFVALGQQATQLAGTFAMLATSTKMIGIFTGLGIAIPIVTSILAYMTRTTEETNKTVDAFQRLRDATSQLYTERMKLTDPKFDENLQGTEDKLKELTTAYEEATRRVQELSLVQSYSGTAGSGAGVAFAALFAQFSKESADAAVKKAEADLRSYEIEKGLAYARERNAAALEARAEQHLRDLEDQQTLQEGFNRKLTTAYSLYARMRGEATALANETARAANALPSFKVSQLAYQYQQYGAGRVAGEAAVKEASPLYNSPAVSGDLGIGSGSSRVAQIKETTVAIEKETEANKKLEGNMNTVSSNINSAFMAMVDGSATVADAFRNMMFNILKSVYEQTVTQPAADAITGLLKGFLGGIGSGGTGSMGLPNPFPNANGNVFSNGSVIAYANGGVVGSPTTFSMSGGKTGLMGEAGPEAIMPLKRGSNGQLGVQVQGGSGGMTVNNNITVTGSDAAAVRMEVAKMIPQITNATKAAIIDAKRRGGQMGAAFQ